MTKVKICGVRTADNALMVARAGADLIGLNFYPETPRYVEPPVAREIVRALRHELRDDCPTLIGVFVNSSAAEVSKIVKHVGLDYAQLSGDESQVTVLALPGVAFKAIRPVDEKDALASVDCFAASFPEKEDAPSILVDAFNPKLYGGTGETARVEVAKAVKGAVARMMLAGGLNPENVAERIRAIRPWSVDVASGVEDGTPGVQGTKSRCAPSSRLCGRRTHERAF